MIEPAKNLEEVFCDFDLRESQVIALCFKQSSKASGVEGGLFELIRAKGGEQGLLFANDPREFEDLVSQLVDEPLM
jgi:hypothetical protein